jgi:predicted nucleic acid-binding protein
MVSDFAAAEFASAIARQVRMGHVNAVDARIAFGSFDAWVAGVPLRAETKSSDIAVAATFLRRLDLSLRTADALNIAIAQRVNATLATFDERMVQNARALGTPVATA